MKRPVYIHMCTDMAYIYASILYRAVGSFFLSNSNLRFLKNNDMKCLHFKSYLRIKAKLLIFLNKNRIHYGSFCGILRGWREGGLFLVFQLNKIMLPSVTIDIIYFPPKKMNLSLYSYTEFPNVHPP